MGNVLSPPDMFNHVFSVVCPITECVNTNVTREKKLASKNKLIYSFKAFQHSSCILGNMEIKM